MLVAAIERGNPTELIIAAYRSKDESADPTVYTINDLTARALDTRQSEGGQVRSFQLAIERLRARPTLAPILIHKPGPLFDESPVRQVSLAGVYRRGPEEVGALLAGVRTQPG